MRGEIKTNGSSFSRHCRGTQFVRESIGADMLELFRQSGLPTKRPWPDGTRFKVLGEAKTHTTYSAFLPKGESKQASQSEPFDPEGYQIGWFLWLYANGDVVAFEQHESYQFGLTMRVEIGRLSKPLVRLSKEALDPFFCGWAGQKPSDAAMCQIWWYKDDFVIAIKEVLVEVTA